MDRREIGCEAGYDVWTARETRPRATECGFAASKGEREGAGELWRGGKIREGENPNSHFRSLPLFLSISLSSPHPFFHQRTSSPHEWTNPSLSTK